VSRNSYVNKVIFWGRGLRSRSRWQWYVQAPNGKIRVYTGAGAKDTAEAMAGSMATRYKMQRRRQDNRLQKLMPKKPKANRRRTTGKSLLTNRKRRSSRRRSSRRRAG
jgi:hypothetical protein